MLRLPTHALVLGMLAGCEHGADHEVALLERPQHLAVGAYHSIVPVDGCSGITGGGGKVPVVYSCDADHVRGMSATFEPKGILEMLEYDEVPAEVAFGTPPNSGARVLHALAPGEVTVTLDVPFDDGSLRTLRIDVSVGEPSAVEFSASCKRGGEPTLAFAMDRSVDIAALVRGDKRQGLHGRIPDLVHGRGLKRVLQNDPELSNHNANVYVFNAVESGLAGWTSGVVATFDDPVTSVAEEEVKGFLVRFDGLNDPGKLAGPHELWALAATVLKDGRVACQGFIPVIRTLTPDRCTGPDGESSWEAFDYGFPIEVHELGDCELQLSTSNGHGESRVIIETGGAVVD